MNEADLSSLRAAIAIERDRVAEQIANLQRSFTEIVDSAELASPDDEHDPEGVTIAYERAQVSGLLQQARDDLVAIDAAAARIDEGTALTCATCAGPIALERLLALPGATTCINCAS